MGKYTLCESGLHVLETQLRQLEAFKDNLDLKEEEDAWRTRQAAHKRERPPDENAMEGTPTPVAEDEPRSRPRRSRRPSPPPNPLPNSRGS